MKFTKSVCWLAVFLTGSAPLCPAQELSMASVGGAPDQGLRIVIALKNNGGPRLSTLRWDLIIPVRQLGVDAAGPLPGSAAVSAGKNVTCNGEWLKAPQIYLYSCALFGSGVRAVGDGVLATLALSAPSPGGKQTPVKLQLHAQGLTPDYKEVSIPKVEVDLKLE